MKKTILILAAFLSLTVTSTFARNNDISKNAQKTFAASFAKANNVKWENNHTFYSATFEMNAHTYTALLSPEGEIIAISRNVLSTELPATLQSVLKSNFASYWVSDLVKYKIGVEDKYYVTVENADQKTILESIDNTEWAVMKTTGK